MLSLILAILLLAAFTLPVSAASGSFNADVRKGVAVVAFCLSAEGSETLISTGTCFFIGDPAKNPEYLITNHYVYQGVIFDTSPVAGKVYKNSENRRKQGVSCGFRRIFRCSICPVRAQPWCA